MNESLLYDLLENKLLQWSDIKNDDCGFRQQKEELLQKLTANLDETNKKLLFAYSLAIETRMDYEYYNLNIKILNFGIKVGMELQQAFEETEK